MKNRISEFLMNIDDLFPDSDPLEGKLISIVRGAFDAHGYQYLQIDPETVTVTIRNARSSYNVFVHASDATDTVRIWSSYGSMVPEERRVAIAEACARINTRIGYGSFELDFEDGELRFRVGVDVEDGVLSQKMVDNMMGCLFHSMERFHPAVMRVAFGDVDPAAAVGEVA